MEHLLHILCFIIHTLLGGAYAEVDAAKAEETERKTCKKHGHDITHIEPCYVPLTEALSDTDHFMGCISFFSQVIYSQCGECSS